MSADTWQTRTMREPDVTVYPQGDDNVVLGFELPPSAPGAALGSVFVILPKSAAASLVAELGSHL